eukprot:TRINITY_DN2233_c0_g2_i1.p1 TRINITY_DN2233_c0_g2~~TRINITY_DN2233_c0_g2_i1.p1  ORF type:complete len:613 (+),score=118.45 TRINITY_DN2233_c0_g2_i1:71-1909(+)
MVQASPASAAVAEKRLLKRPPVSHAPGSPILARTSSAPNTLRCLQHTSKGAGALQKQQSKSQHLAAALRKSASAVSFEDRAPLQQRIPPLTRCKSLVAAGAGSFSTSTTAVETARTTPLLLHKVWYIVEPGPNNPELVRQLMRNRRGWAPRLVRISDEDRSAPEADFLWSEYPHGPFLTAMAKEQQQRAFASRTASKRSPAAAQLSAAALLSAPPLPSNFVTLPPPRVHNHFEGNGALVTKVALLRHLGAFYLRAGRDPFDVCLPLTFVVDEPRQEDAGWREAFEFIATETGQKLWLVKPGGWAARGSGIGIFDNVKDIATAVNQPYPGKARLHQQHQPDRVWIVQKYLETPFLIHGRKFDIRVYCLVVQDPRGGLRAYAYREGYVRTISALFSTDSLDRAAHLSNDEVQCKGEDYGKVVEANKLSFQGLQDYLNQHHPEDGIKVAEHLLPRMMTVMSEAVSSVIDKLNPRRIANCFELFGFDFLVDTAYKVWLLEANANPCIDTSRAPFFEDLMPKMLDGALRLSLDKFFPRAAFSAAPSTDDAAALWEPLHIGEGSPAAAGGYQKDKPPIGSHWLPEVTTRASGNVEAANLGGALLAQPHRKDAMTSVNA